jgi:peptidoglycan/LPS O-acetylase OafA/YrhL
MKRHFLAMRGIAILLVVLNHTIALGTSYPIQAGITPVAGIERHILSGFELLGFVAVPIFLFISGCFFAYTAKGNQSRLSYKVVFENLKHILWPYIIWSIVFYIWLYIGHNEHYSLTGYLKNLIVGYPFHFVPLILFFYLTAPILVWFTRKAGGVTIIALMAFYQIALINILEPGIYGFVFPNWMNYLTPPVISRTYADWGTYFPLGLIYTFNMVSLDVWLARLKTVMIALASFFFIITVLVINKHIEIAWARHVYPLLFVLYLPNINRKRIPFVKFFEDIGKKAYGLYLIHLTLMDILLTAVLIWITPLLNYPVLLLPAIFVLAVMIPVIFMDTIGKPASRNFYRLLFG